VPASCDIFDKAERIVGSTEIHNKLVHIFIEVIEKCPRAAPEAVYR